MKEVLNSLILTKGVVADDLIIGDKNGLAKPFEKRSDSLKRIELSYDYMIKALSNVNENDLIIFMPGLGGDINNFRWIGIELSRRGWPVLFIDHKGSNSRALLEVLEGSNTIPSSADFFLYRIKDLSAVIKAHNNGKFGLANNSYLSLIHI
mgnify:CR=1 FL=1